MIYDRGGGNAFVNGKNALGLIAYGAEYLSSDELFQSSSSIGAITQTLKVMDWRVSQIYLIDVNMKGGGEGLNWGEVRSFLIAYFWPLDSAY